jgi:phosphoribosylaminoimidazole-succinocarboxamide synthase
MTTATVQQTNLPLPLIARGKVRDIYAVGADKLLLVTTDRLSAFDVILPNPIPDKGRVLNQISLFWFEKFQSLIANHVITADVSKMGLDPALVREHGAFLEGRSLLAKRAKPLPVECVIRGYITGSGWKDYLKTGEVCGHKLPAGLKQCQQLAEPLFTPATKAETGHDENISTQEVERLVGPAITAKLVEISKRIYVEGSKYAREKGIMIADTKFEFGMLGDELIIIDEVLTPDSSRFWPADKYEVGRDQESFDKQIVRNWLEVSKWDKNPPAPCLPEDVVEKTSQAYRRAYEQLTGQKL